MRMGSGKKKNIEAVSEPQIRFEGKAQADEKAQHTRQYVSILKRSATPPSGLRWSFEMASRGWYGLSHAPPFRRLGEYR